MKTGRVLFTALTAALLAGQVSAEPPTGSRLGNRLKPLANPSHRDQDELAQRAAQCAATLYRSDATKVFEATSAEARDSARAAIGMLVRCSMSYLLGGEAEIYVFRQNPPIYDGMLGEELVKGSGRLSALPAMPLVENYNRAWFGMTGRPVALDDMAVCVVNVAPAQVGALFNTKIKTDEERAAIGNLGPAMGQCLQEDVELKLDERWLRSALGEAMYRRIYLPDAAPAASAEGAAR